MAIRLSMVGLVVLASVVWAEENEIPHVFEDGKPGKAAEVNENFSSLHERVKALEEIVASLSANNGGGGTDPGTSDPGTNDPGGTDDPVVTDPGSGSTIDSPNAYYQGVVLNDANQIFGGGDITTAAKLVTADGVILKYISSGSLSLEDQTFVVYDANVAPFNPSDPIGLELEIYFDVIASGEIALDDRHGKRYFYTKYYEDENCVGQAYEVSQFSEGYNAEPYTDDGTNYFRSPTGLTGEELRSFTSKSKEDFLYYGESQGCQNASILVSDAGIPVEYDIQIVIDSISTPLEIVEP